MLPKVIDQFRDSNRLRVYQYRVRTSRQAHRSDQLSASTLTAHESLTAKGQRIAATGPIDQVTGNLQAGKDLPNTEHVVPDFFWEQRRVRPGESRDLSRRVEAVGMVEEELEELEFSMGKHRLSSLVAYHAMTSLAELISSSLSHFPIA
jgi:hypothetical protein